MSVIGATILRLKLQRLNRQLDQGATIDADGRMKQTRDNEDEGLPAKAIDKGFRFLL